MSTVKRFEDLDVWQISRELCREVYELTLIDSFSRDFSLKDQIRRSSGSVMDNIAEGFERGGRKEFIQYLSIAKASCGETRAQLYRALDRKYISEEQFEKAYTLANDLGRKIYNFMTYLSKSDYKGIKYK